jgi:ankyrin repeat protein
MYVKSPHIGLLLNHKKAKLDPNVWNRDLMSPLHLAAFNQDYSTIKLLVEAGACVNARNVWGISPLTAALGASTNYESRPKV